MECKGDIHVRVSGKYKDWNISRMECKAHLILIHNALRNQLEYIQNGM